MPPVDRTRWVSIHSIRLQCSLQASLFKESMGLHIDAYGHLMAVDYRVPTAECSEEAVEACLFVNIMMGIMVPDATPSYARSLQRLLWSHAREF